MVKGKQISGIRISYSSSNVFQGCQRKFYHQKVRKTEPDTDRIDDGKALRIGKAFHEVLELCKHSNSILSNSHYKKSFQNNEVDNPTEQGLIVAMVRKYISLHERTNLKVVGIEIEIGDRINYIGFIDVVLADVHGNWWIVDLKTAARLNTSLLSRLSRDPQLNIYSYFANEVAEKCKLDLEKFQGVRYRVTTKSSIKKNPKESFSGYVKRCSDRMESYDIAVPKDKLIPKKVYAHFMNLLKQMRNLENISEEEVPQNFTYCETYFKPCEYWSQCYGKTFTENAEQYEIFDTDNIGDLTAHASNVEEYEDLDFL